MNKEEKGPDIVPKLKKGGRRADPGAPGSKRGGWITLSYGLLRADYGQVVAFYPAVANAVEKTAGIVEAQHAQYAQGLG